MIKVGLSSSADLNVSVSGGAADVGVTYEAVGGKFTVNASGVITPIKSGVGIVVVKNSSTGEVLRKIAVAVVPDAQLANFQNIQSTATAVVSGGGGSSQSGSSVTFVDQEVVTFDANGEYVLAQASGGIANGSVPMLTFDGVVQDGVTSGKRFEVVNDAGGVKRKVKLISNTVLNNFDVVNNASIHNLSGNSKIVAMTSNTTQASGSNVQSVSASSEYSSDYAAFKAVDKSLNSFWDTQNVLNASTPVWWQINYQTPVTFEYAKITARTDYPIETPTTFEIRGSNDNMVTWDVLHSATGLTWVAGETKQFANANPSTAYSSIRVHVTANGGGGYVSMREFDIASGGQGALSIQNVYKRHVITANDSTPALGSGDFTVEAWIYPTSIDGYSQIAGAVDDNTFSFGLGSSDGLFLWAGTWVANHGGSQAAIQTNAWNHVAVVRSGSTVKTYVNGVHMATGTSSATYSFTRWAIGDSSSSDGDDRAFPGYIRNVRISKAARYTSNFTPFAVSSNVEDLSDAFSSNDILVASFDSLQNGNMTWSYKNSLLPESGTTCLVSYRV